MKKAKIVTPTPAGEPARGGCGMDGKAATAIRTLADAPANRGLDTTVALREIATIIERVDNRCAAADGPVSSTLQEMRQDEISRIYALATGAAAPAKENKPCE